MQKIGRKLVPSLRRHYPVQVLRVLSQPHFHEAPRGFLTKLIFFNESVTF
jgi:hypothetical protein